jgi:hypothetical protein
MPFWYTILFFCLTAYYFSKAFEIVFYAALLDIIFWVAESSLVLPVYTVFALAIYILFETIKPKLRVRNI